jgi:hypothetical protein
VDPQNPLWRADFPGASTPVIANGRLYIMGYLGEGADLQEGVACFDAETGQKLWQQLYNDFISDTIYLRYATASPAIDPETGNVFMQGTAGDTRGLHPRRQTALEAVPDGRVRTTHVSECAHRIATD